MKIADVRAYPTSFPIPVANRVALGIGTAVKRDAVLVKVSTDEGLVGWGEAHHGRAHTAVAKLIETTLKQLVLGMDADDVMHRDRLATDGAEPLGSTPTEFAAFIRRELDKWTKVAQAAGMEKQ